MNAASIGAVLVAATVATPPPLRLKADGSFSIVQIADVHTGGRRGPLGCHCRCCCIGCPDLPRALDGAHLYVHCMVKVPCPCIPRARVRVAAVLLVGFGR